jgi:hypothetical protein
MMLTRFFFFWPWNPLLRVTCFEGLESDFLAEKGSYGRVRWGVENADD